MIRASRALMALSLMGAALVALPSSADASHRSIDVQPLREVVGFRTGDRIPGGVAIFERDGEGVRTRVVTRGEPRGAYSLWYLVFNAPENCIDGCGRHNIFNEDTGTPNFDQIENARISVVFAGDGDVARPFGGFMRFDGSLAEGEVPQGEQQVAFGRLEDNPVVPFDAPVTGIEDIDTAEIHVVVRYHGEAVDDPEQLEFQLSGLNACRDADGNLDGAPATYCADRQTAANLP